jgi:hypothetical protein
VVPPSAEWIACWASTVSVPTTLHSKAVRRAQVAIHVSAHCHLLACFISKSKRENLQLQGHVNLYLVDISLMYITRSVVSSPNE